MCRLCGLELETTEHLFLTCCKAQAIWHHTAYLMGSQTLMLSEFASGAWVICQAFSSFAKAVIASVAWHIWKARCDAIFRDSSINVRLISFRAFHFAKNNFTSHSPVFGRKLLLNNFTDSDSLFLFSAAYWNEDTKVSSAGFFISNSQYNLSLVGCCPLDASSKLDASIQAIIFALRIVLKDHVSVRNIFISCPDLMDLYSSYNSRRDCLFRGKINTLMHLISAYNQPRIHDIPKIWTSPAYKLACFASNLHSTSLFHSGKELPRWIMRSFYSAGFFF